MSSQPSFLHEKGVQDYLLQVCCPVGAAMPSRNAAELGKSFSGSTQTNLKKKAPTAKAFWTRKGILVVSRQMLTDVTWWEMNYAPTADFKTVETNATSWRQGLMALSRMRIPPHEWTASPQSNGLALKTTGKELLQFFMYQRKMSPGIYSDILVHKNSDQIWFSPKK